MPSRIIVDPEGDVLLLTSYELPPPSPTPEPLPAPDLENSINNSDGKPYAADKSKVVNGKVKQTQELLVSSKVISLASPVFRAMLYGEFSEGAALSMKKNSDDSLPFQLSLPEDDAKAMTLLCQLLHFDVNDVPNRPDPELLEKLVMTCDKYQCIPAIKYCGGIWVRNWLLYYEKTDPPIEELCHLFIFAYVADLEFEFAEVAWRLLLYHEGPFAGPSTQAITLIGHPLLCEDVCTRLDSKRFKFCQEYHRAVMKPFMFWKWGSLTQGCCRAATAIARYTEALQNVGIFPYDLKFARHKFHKLLGGADQLEYVSVQECSGSSSWNQICVCSQDAVENLVGNIQSTAKFIRNEKAWFGCLDCLKTVETSDPDRQCRVEHGDGLSLEAILETVF